MTSFLTPKAAQLRYEMETPEIMVSAMIHKIHFKPAISFGNHCSTLDRFERKYRGIIIGRCNQILTGKTVSEYTSASRVGLIGRISRLCNSRKGEERKIPFGSNGR